MLRTILLSLTLWLGSSGLPGAAQSASDAGAIPITVYKTPTCGCCSAWSDYLERNGFAVTRVDLDDLTEVKSRHGVSRRLQSCHTAVTGGYVIEGHVPADDIRRLLEEKPEAVGLTAPGMPMMSPGMHSIEPKDYDVLLFSKDGQAAVFSKY